MCEPVRFPLADLDVDTETDAGILSILVRYGQEILIRAQARVVEEEELKSVMSSSAVQGSAVFLTFLERDLSVYEDEVENEVVEIMFDFALENEIEIACLLACQEDFKSFAHLNIDPNAAIRLSDISTICAIPISSEVWSEECWN